LLYEFCQYLGAPLVSLQVIVLLPISVASGLTAKYLFDAGMVRATMLKAMAHIFALESFIFGAIVLVVLAGVGQVFVNLDSKVVALGLLLIFVAELLLYVLWLIQVTLDEKSFASFNPANMSLKTVSAKPKKAMQTDGHTSAKKLTKNLNESNEVAGEAKLTAKELDVLSQLVAGKKNKEIAEILNISEVSVKVHKSRMINKLGVKTLPELTAALDRFKLGATQTDITEKQLDLKDSE
jgi:DNA-binding CsgD family transcriptional regulator